MDAISAIQGGLDLAEMVSMAYLGDLSDEELLLRPHPDCNHLNWQVGHLICSEHELLNLIAPGVLPELPAGFAEKYSRATAALQDASQFASKDELMRVYQEQRAGTKAVLAKTSAADLDLPTGVDYAPNRAAIFRMQGEHWLMHCGQWVIVRRLCGKPIVI
jgi:hypothetical protein